VLAGALLHTWCTAHVARDRQAVQGEGHQHRCKWR
jgi:hypothetical protein